MFISAVTTYPVLGVLAVAALVFSALFMLRVYAAAFFGPVNPKWNGLRDIGPWQATPRVILIAVLLVFGFFPSWVLDLIGSSTRLVVGRF